MSILHYVSMFASSGSLILLLGISWRASAWKQGMEDRLTAIEKKLSEKKRWWQL